MTQGDRLDYQDLLDRLRLKGEWEAVEAIESLDRMMRRYELAVITARDEGARDAQRHIERLNGTIEHQRKLLVKLSAERSPDE